MKKLFATSVVAIGLAAAVPAAFSQAPDSAADPAAAPASRFEHRHGDRAFRNPTERVEARLAYIRTALKITSAQEPQWNAYANVLRKQAAAMGERFKEHRAQMEKGAGEHKRPSVVERHEFMRARMTVMSQHLDELLAVEKPLYAALSPEQQRVADEVLVLGGRGGHDGHGGHGRFHRTSFGRG